MIPRALQLVGALQIVAIITTNFSFIVLYSEVSFNQCFGTAQKSRLALKFHSHCHTSTNESNKLLLWNL